MSKQGEEYHTCHVLLDDGTEAKGYGLDFEVGDLVECFYHYGQVKIRKTPNRLD